MFASLYIWAFLPLLLVPVLIHLIHRQKYPRFAYSTLMFFERIVRQNAFQRRFRHLLLMSLRILAMLLLLLAFSRVGCRGLGVGDRSEAVVVVIDASASMTRTDGGPGADTLLDTAREQAQRLVDELPDNAMIGLVVNSSPPRMLAAPATDRDALRSALDSLEPFYRRESSWQAVALGARHLQGIRAGLKRVVVLTDYQNESWQLSDEAEHHLSDAEGIDVEVLALGGGHEANVAIAGVEMPRFGITPGKKALFRAKIVNFGKADVNNLLIEAGLGTPEQAAEQEQRISISAGETLEVSLFLSFPMPGPQPIWFRLPEDDFAADNVWIDAVNVAHTVSVLNLAPRQASQPAPDQEEEGTPSETESEPESETAAAATAEQTGQVNAEDDETDAAAAQTLGDDQFYLQNALAADLKRTRIDAITADMGELDSGGLYGYGTVFLTAVPALNDRQISQLEGYLNRGGGLVVFLGAGTVPETVAELSRSEDGKAPLLPATIRDSVSTPAAIDHVRFGESESLRGLHELEEMLTGVRYSQRYALVPTGSETRVLATFDDGTPALVSGAYGQGHVVMLAGGLAWPQSDLALQAVFPELVHRLVESQSGLSSDGRRALAPGESFAQRYPNSSVPERLTLTDGNGASRAINKLETEDGYTLYSADTANPGYYLVESAYSEGEPLTPLTSFVVNLGAADSDLRQASRSVADAELGGARLTVAAFDSDRPFAHLTSGGYRELTRLILVGLLLLLICENIISWKTR